MPALLHAMHPDILILGQGLAGTVLGWELARAGRSFAIVDAGHGDAATMAAAGIINPITGRRLVKSWRVDALLPRARESYRWIQHELGGSELWSEMVVRRIFADERERAVYGEKQATGELAPFAREGDDAGFLIAEAARVDLPALLQRSRDRWRREGRLREGAESVAGVVGDYALVIDCRGRAGAREERFGFVPWEFSRGEMLEGTGRIGGAPHVILNARHWALPVADGGVWLGATHEPGVSDPSPTADGRATLEASAAKLLGTSWRFTGQRAGVRVHLPDKRPVAGRHPVHQNLGVLNGLGGKGALWAPFLAQQWVRHLTHGEPFDPEIDVRRFVK